MNLQDLAQQERDLEITIGGEALAFTYRPHLITTRFRNEHTTIADFLAHCLTAWDIQDGAEDLPIEEQTMLERLPDIVTRMIYAAIGEDLYPKAWRAPRSAAAS